MFICKTRLYQLSAMLNSVEPEVKCFLVIFPLRRMRQARNLNGRSELNAILQRCGVAWFRQKSLSPRGDLSTLYNLVLGWRGLKFIWLNLKGFKCGILSQSMLHNSWGLKPGANYSLSHLIPALLVVRMTLKMSKISSSDIFSL